MDEKVYLENLEKARDDESSRYACEKVLTFYVKNSTSLYYAYDYYNGYKNSIQNYVLEPIVQKNLPEYIKNAYLLITVNEIEEGVLLRFLSELNQGPLESYLIEQTVFHCCRLMFSNTEYCLVHTRSKRTGDEFMRRTINFATKTIGEENIRYIYLLGICYGIDMNSQELGDVVISNHVVGYRVNFRDGESYDEIKIEPELEFNEKPNETYIDKISGFLTYYDVTNSNHIMPPNKLKISFGKYLSANCLMSSKKAKDSIIDAMGNIKPKAMAGEMEACGIFKSVLYSNKMYTNWLIIKSICDWGENKNICPKDIIKNDLIKNSLQAFAMINTCNSLYIMLDKKLMY